MLTEIQQEVLNGNVTAVRHPTLPLTLYNYTEKCQYERRWNSINLQCRGLVLDDQGNVVARPLAKFFNYEELGSPSVDPNEIVSITEKEDGSCIIAFWYDGDWHCCTRGSFTSPQAELAKELLDTSVFETHGVYRVVTYIFELVGPSNRIVTRKYDKDRLVLLTAIITCAGVEITRSALQQALGSIYSFPQTYTWDGLIERVRESSDPNFEGVVVLLKNGTRFKVKSNTYKHLHRVLTGEFTKSRIFNLWKDQFLGRLDITGIPDEFFQEIQAKLDEVQVAYDVYKFQLLDTLADMQLERAAGKSRGQMARDWASFTYLLPLVFGTTRSTTDEYIFNLWEKTYLE